MTTYSRLGEMQVVEQEKSTELCFPKVLSKIGPEDIIVGSRANDVSDIHKVPSPEQDGREIGGESGMGEGQGTKAKVGADHSGSEGKSCHEPRMCKASKGQIRVRC